VRKDREAIRKKEEIKILKMKILPPEAKPTHAINSKEYKTICYDY
jgi:hypothetical protein